MRYILIILVFLSVSANAQMVIKAHANYRPYAAPVSANLLLDDYPNAAAAYSLRKLDKDYTGAAIRVRKDTTGQPESDIGFTASGDLDTAALKSFLNARSGFVTTWYDQSGNSGRNAVQTTQANQPRIANLGIIERINNKVSIFFDGSNDNFGINNFVQNNGFYSFFGVTQIANTTGNKTVMSGDFQSNPRSAQYMTIISSNPRTLAFDVNTAISDQSAAIVANTMYLLSGHKYSGFIEAYTNGATNGATTFTNASNSVNNGIYIGSQLATSAFMQGYISECILYGINNYSNRTGIENNINDYYNIYWNGDFTGILDTYPNSAAAYSLRNLSSTYKGPLIRVRKDTTGQPEIDVYGDYFGNLDTVGLKQFLSTRSGFISVWYDQSGQGRNASQSTQANQPRIANLGVIDRENSRPTVRFDGSNDHYNLGDILDIGQNSFLSLAFCNISNNNSIYAKSAAASASNRYALIVEAGVSYSFLHTDITRHATATGSGKKLYCSQIIRGTSNTLFFNNSQVGQNNTIDNYNMNSTYPFLIGAYNDVGGGGAGFYYLNGTLSELLIYLSDQSSNRTGLSNNINTYYSIY